MSIPTPALDKLREMLPDDLKDIRLNLSSVLLGENLEPSQYYCTVVYNILKYNTDAVIIYLKYR